MPTFEEMQQIYPELTQAEYAASMAAYEALPLAEATDIVEVEYHAEGGETIRESHGDEGQGLYVNHSMCGEPGHYCPTGVHVDVPLDPGASA